MKDVTQNHEERETIVVDVTLPGHGERVTTPLFVRTRKEALEACDNRCEVSGATVAEAGPQQLHHFFVERCTAPAVDPRRLHHMLGVLQAKATAAHKWFDEQLAAGKTYDEIWTDPYAFTDDMTVNGLALCKRLHTGKGEGIHYMPFPLWSLWWTGKQGFAFVGQDCIKDELEGASSVYDGQEAS